MFGHYLLTLTPEQEDRLLTLTFEPRYDDVRMRLGLPQLPDHAWGEGDNGCGCLVLVATAWRSHGYGPQYAGLSPGNTYERLAERFGVERINTAVRTRILSNRAQRLLSADCPVEAHDPR